MTPEQLTADAAFAESVRATAEQVAEEDIPSEERCKVASSVLVTCASTIDALVAEVRTLMRVDDWIGHE